MSPALARPDDPVDVLARTVYGEARGESVRGKEAVAAVVINRVAAAEQRRRQGRRHWWGHDVPSVCLKAYQFSCWNHGDPNRDVLMRVGTDDAVFRICRRIARRAVAGILADPTDGATHYHHVDVLPGWAVAHAPCAEIGAHLFYNDIA